MKYIILPVVLFIGYQAVTYSTKTPGQNALTAKPVKPAAPVRPIIQPTIAPKKIADSVYTYFSTRNGFYGLKNRKGKVIVYPCFTSVGEVHNYRFPVVFKGHHGFSDTAGHITWLNKKYLFDTLYNELSTETFINTSGGGLAAVIDTKGKKGFITYEQKQVIACKYEDIQPFSEGLSCVYANGKYGFINKQGKTVIPFKYTMAYTFHENRAAVSVKNKMGFIDTTGKLVIPYQYENAWRFSEGMCIVNQSEAYTDYFFIDVNGKVAIKQYFSNADSFENGKALIEQNGKCWEIDKTGKKIKYRGTECFVGC